MSELRIQKYIADCGIASRRSAEEMIRQGRVTVGGVGALIGQKIDPDSDEVCVDGKIITRREGDRVYVLLFKPAGFVSSAKDERGRPTVCDLVKLPGKRLFPAGRLDMYTEGLIVLSDDGDAVNRLIHPSGNVEKTYTATVNGEVSEDALRSLRSPIEIDGRMTRPAEAETVSCEKGKTVLRFVIREGRNRQIRRLCERAGLCISKLVRTKIGMIEDPSLAPGKWRYLTPEEIKYLKGL